jgi:hypothetical protein|tara:strand:+ start:708 stop:818 length:111 start_codon:yes stop_codon:yes gene_type:complete
LPVGEPEFFEHAGASNAVIIQLKFIQFCATVSNETY